jgi:hypothetical protein
MLLGVRQQHEGGAITSAPLRWELDRCPHPHAHQVIKGRVCLCLSSPWLTPSFERTGRSPLRTGRATFTASGSPRVGIPHWDCCTQFVIDSFSVLLQTSPESLSGLSEYPIVDSLAPFPMWLAFPTSEYYGASEALDSRLLVVRTLVDLHTLTFLQARPTFTKLDSNKII